MEFNLVSSAMTILNTQCISQYKWLQSTGKSGPTSAQGATGGSPTEMWQRWIKAESPHTLWLLWFPPRLIVLWPNQTLYLTALFSPCLLNTSIIWEAPPINLNVQISIFLLTLKWHKNNNFKNTNSNMSVL